MRSPLVDEKALIGAALLTGDGHAVISLEPAEFESDFFGLVWKRMQTMKVIDQVALESEFFDHRQELADSASGIPTMSNMPKIAKRIREAAHRRRVAKALQDAHGLLMNCTDISKVGDVVIAALDNVGSDDGWSHLSDFLLPAYADLERAQLQGVNCNFVPTGFKDFDNEFGGLQQDGLIVVAGRPAMGKSAFAAALARNAAKRAPSLIMSLEMSGKQLAMRYYASESGVCMQKMMQGKLATEDWRKIAMAQSALVETGIFINDKRSRTVSDVVAEARRFKRVHGNVGMIVVDYLTLMDLPESYSKNESVAEATRRLTGLAGEIDCPVVLLSQLNRDLEKRKDKTPQMSDLRDSGAIEQDAHQIIFPFRPEIYDDKPELKGLALVHMAKNRNGSTGKVKMAWVGESATFKDMSMEDF